MTNHPNRGRGRPAFDPAQMRKRLTMRLAPDIVDAAQVAGRERVETMLRDALRAAELLD